MTDLHNWDTIEELVRAEKRQFKINRKWSAIRTTYLRTGLSADTYYGDLVPERKALLVRLHVRPCV